MLSALAIAAALTAAGPPQEAPQDPVRLEDVIAEPRRLEAAAEAFVDEVAAPVRRRPIARWRGGVCVGVANLDPALAQAIVDRVSDVARDLGLRAGGPGCNPTIVIIATTDASAFTESFVARRPGLFRPGGAGMEQGDAALREFIDTDRPVRWWNVSLSVDTDTGQPAVRIPGQMERSVAAGDSVLDYAPVTRVRIASRLNSPYRQDLKRTFVIVDVDRIGDVSLAQLSDYIAMVSLAQVRPDAQTAEYETILNLFDGPTAMTGLTGWDTAYLRGLYDSEWYRRNERSQVQAIAYEIGREYRNAGATRDGD